MGFVCYCCGVFNWCNGCVWLVGDFPAGHFQQLLVLRIEAHQGFVGGIMEFIFGKLDPLAVFVFIFATLFVTELLKYVMGRVVWFCRLLEIGFFKVILSWLAAAGTFYILHLVLHSFPVTEESVFRCFFWVLLLNGGYKIYTLLRKMVKSGRNI